MPWCEPCSRFLSPPSVGRDGRCPSCGHPVEAGRAHPPAGEAEPGLTEEEVGPVPWHLRLMAVALAVYLGYRLLQGIGWLWHRIAG